MISNLFRTLLIVIALSAITVIAVAGQGGGGGGGNGAGGGSGNGAGAGPAGSGARDQDRDQDRLRDPDQIRLRDQDRLADPDQDRDRQRDRLREDADLNSDQAIYGWQLMTRQEIAAYRQRLRQLSSVDERSRYREQHRQTMQTRAQQRGVSLPN